MERTLGEALNFTVTDFKYLLTLREVELDNLTVCSAIAHQDSVKIKSIKDAL